MYGIIEPFDNAPALRNNKSILAQCLTKEIYAKLYWAKTSSGYTIDDAIQVGVDCEDHEIGFLLGDYECIEIFEPLLGPMLNLIHPCFDYKDKNMSHIGNLKMIKFDGNYTLKDFVVEYAFHLRRNLRGYSLPSHCTRAERREINKILIYILKQLEFDASLPHFHAYYAKRGSKTLQKRASKALKIPILTVEKEPQNDDDNANENDYKKENNEIKEETKQNGEYGDNGHNTDTKNRDNDNDNDNDKEEDDEKTVNGYNETHEAPPEIVTDTASISHVVDLVNIDDLTLTELEEMGLAPSRDASITPEFLIGGLSRDFPDARTLFYNQKAMVGAWTNHENHLEMIIQHTIPDLEYVYKKYVDIYLQFRRILKRKEMAWIRHRRLGIVTTSPKHFGTGLTIQCSIRAPYLAIHPKFMRILNKRNLEFIGQSQDIIDLETMHTLGRSEWSIATDLGNALIDLCRMEKALARNKGIDQLI